MTIEEELARWKTQAADMEKERDLALKLAYIDEPYYPGRTYKERCAELEARLALAEAVCEALVAQWDRFGMPAVEFALSAWRSAKGDA